ncbi:MAG: polysaccharide deacetylase family protein [Deltaproteobacteria bacterium]|nr:polysaccharide deacetylase family protein [Deltaproteobacteria bacterium]
MSPIPVFMYHHVSPHKGDMVSVTPDVFEAQMRFLKEAGYRTLSADEVVGYILSDVEIKEKTVALTFDDGYLDNYVHAFPVLKEYNIKATIFIVTDWVEEASNIVRSQESGVRSNETPTPSHREGKELIATSQADKVILNWDRIREMEGSGLVEFYSHTMSHKKCAELSDEELIRELEGSKKVMEQKLNKPRPYLCWPKGSYTPESVKAAKDAGYTALFTTKRGVVKKGSDRFCIERIVVKDRVRWFKNKARIYTNPLFSKIYLALRGRG